ncbi:MAG: type VII secretion integral membrane protein EccD, partial [Actinoallomurus sp.]
LVPGLGGLAVIVVDLAAGVPAGYVPAVVGGLVLVAGLLLVVARVMPGRRMLPHWGRIADLSHSVAAMAVIPLVLAVVGLYARVRAGWA